jgi:hypothetical protein
MHALLMRHINAPPKKRSDHRTAGISQAMGKSDGGIIDGHGAVLQRRCFSSEEFCGLRRLA